MEREQLQSALNMARDEYDHAIDRMIESSVGTDTTTLRAAVEIAKSALAEYDADHGTAARKAQADAGVIAAQIANANDWQMPDEATVDAELAASRENAARVRKMMGWTD